MPKPLQKCLLHIGCEKTGTSAIQRFLSMNRPSLKKQGFIYPVAGGTLYGGSQTGYPILARSEAWLTDMGKAIGLLTPEAVENYRAHLSAQLELEISRVRRAHTLIISSEHFHSRLRTAAEIAQLRSFLEPLCETFEVVVYFRRQDRVAVSLYATHIKSGNPTPEPFLPAIDLPETYYYRYDEVFQNWAQVFGAAAMRPGIFHPSELLQGDLLRDFCAHSGIPYEGKKIPGPQNASLSPEASRFLQEVNRQIRDGLMPSDLVDRSLLIREIERLFPGRVFPMNKASAQRFLGQFDSHNAQLQVLAFPQRNKPVFDSDFSEYPELMDPPIATAADCALVALHLVRGMLDGSTTLRSP